VVFLLSEEVMQVVVVGLLVGPLKPVQRVQLDQPLPMGRLAVVPLRLPHWRHQLRPLLQDRVVHGEGGWLHLPFGQLLQGLQVPNVLLSPLSRQLSLVPIDGSILGAEKLLSWLGVYGIEGFEVDLETPDLVDEQDPHPKVQLDLQTLPLG